MWHAKCLVKPHGKVEVASGEATSANCILEVDAMLVLAYPPKWLTLASASRHCNDYGDRLLDQSNGI